MIQEYVGCCGAENNRSWVFVESVIDVFMPRYDYINAHKMVPKSCKHPVTGKHMYIVWIENRLVKQSFVTLHLNCVKGISGLL